MLLQLFEVVHRSHRCASTTDCLPRFFLPAPLLNKLQLEPHSNHVLLLMQCCCSLLSQGLIAFIVHVCAVPHSSASQHSMMPQYSNIVNCAAQVRLVQRELIELLRAVLMPITTDSFLPCCSYSVVVTESLTDQLLQHCLQVLLAGLLVLPLLLAPCDALPLLFQLEQQESKPHRLASEEARHGQQLPFANARACRCDATEQGLQAATVLLLQHGLL